MWFVFVNLKILFIILLCENGAKKYYISLCYDGEWQRKTEQVFSSTHHHFFLSILPKSVTILHILYKVWIIVTLQASMLTMCIKGKVMYFMQPREKGKKNTIFTPPISYSRANSLQNKSQCLSPNLVWQCVAAHAILGSLWCQSPISPMTFFSKKEWIS